MFWMLFACIDYNIEPEKEPNFGEDTAGLENEVDDTLLLDDTGAEEEDTPEEDIVEEMVANAKIYANTSDELYEIDPENGQASFIGGFQYIGESVDHFEDIAIDLTGHMYGGTGEFLYLINPSTAEVRPVCSLELRTTALAFTSDGELIIGSEYSLYKMNIETCEYDILIANSYYETSGDIVGLPDGYLYWTVRGGWDQDDQLVRVDPRTGEETWVGYLGESRLYGVGYANDELFGFSGSGDVVGIDPHTGVTHALKQYEDFSWWGATTNPVVWE